jgi:mRNA-degrading endonuclease RelE of RelBE toxin-antitoxin system
LAERFAAIVDCIERLLAEQAYRLSKPLAEPFAGWRSARYGADRIVFGVDEDKTVMVIGRIGHPRGRLQAVAQSALRSPAGRARDLFAWCPDVVVAGGCFEPVLGVAGRTEVS